MYCFLVYILLFSIIKILLWFLFAVVFEKCSHFWPFILTYCEQIQQIKCTINMKKLVKKKRKIFFILQSSYVTNISSKSGVYGAQLPDG